MRVEMCPERLALSKKISDAIAEVYLAKRDLDSAKHRNKGNLEESQSALAHARVLEREAVRALDGHSRSHGCAAVIL